MKPVSHEDLLHRIRASDRLPTLPPVAMKLLYMTSGDEATLPAIASLVSQDVSLTTRMLKVANSAFYTFKFKVSTINQAVSALGLNAVRNLVLSCTFLSLREGASNARFDYALFWRRSLANAVAARLVLQSAGVGDPEEAFVGGLLQNLGELLFARTLPDELERFLATARLPGETLCAAEDRILGLNHAAAGAALAQQWNLPPACVELIRHHHDPSGYTGGDPDLAPVLAAVALSDLLTSVLFAERPEAQHRTFKSEASRLLNLQPVAITAILDRVHLELDKAAAEFDVSMEPTRSVQDVLQEANVRLSLLNLTYEELNRQLVDSKIRLERLTRELEEKNRHLEDLANRDGLTAVYNHRYFHGFLDKEIKRAARHRYPLGLLMADIDHFKVFNDTWGHQAGDFVLREFCRFIQPFMREYDLLARYGGEEFVIVLPETDLPGTLTSAERVRRAIANRVMDDGTRGYRVTVSIGVAVAQPTTEGFSKSDFIDQADSALYLAKKRGRNQVAQVEPKKGWFGS